MDFAMDPGVLHPGRSGLRRHILVEARPGAVRVDLEDDFHHFTLRLVHDFERVLAVEAEAVRHPWTLCIEATRLIETKLVGTRLDAVAEFDSPLQHCTHQFDLAVLAAGHVRDIEPHFFSMFVADPEQGFSRAELRRDGLAMLAWDLDGQTILPPSPQAGLNLRKLREWLPTLPRHEQEPATLLRRAVFISGGREHNRRQSSAAERVAHRLGGCYVFQPERAPQAATTPGTARDFSRGGVPLVDRMAAVRMQA